jgi:uncharacterized protein YjbI with pentapeptide repeats
MTTSAARPMSKAKALSSKTDFTGRVLRGDDLSHQDYSRCTFDYADMRDVHIKETNLEGATFIQTKGIISIANVGSEGRTLFAVEHKDGLYVKTGCFYGKLDEFESAVKERYDSESVYYREYCAVIEFLKLWYSNRDARYH